MTPRKPRVYVIGPSSEPERCHAAVLRLRELGVEVEHDWTEQVLSIGPQNDAADREKAAGWAQGDLAAVRRADACLLLFSTTTAVLVDPRGPRDSGCHDYRDVLVPSFGSGVELGVALSHGIPVVSSGKGSIFLSLTANYGTDEDAIAMAASAAQGAAWG